jgi:hypothetical protein
MIEKQHAASDPSARFCSFCKASEAEVGSLIEGPGIEGVSPVFICAECVDLGARIIQQQKQMVEQPAAPADIAGAPLRQVLTSLDDVEFRIIELRYGLADGREYSHEEIAGLLDITPERAREMEAAAVKKLKQTSG